MIDPVSLFQAQERVRANMGEAAIDQVDAVLCEDGGHVML
jgi:hypothetical protein